MGKYSFINLLMIYKDNGHYLLITDGLLISETELFISNSK